MQTETVSQPATTAVAPVATSVTAEVEKTVAPSPDQGAPTQTEAKAEDAGKPEPATEEKPEKPRQKASERIGELYGRMKDAERRADLALQELARLRQPLVTQEEYDTLPFAQQQMVDVRQAVRAERAAEVEQARQHATEVAQQALVQGFEERVREASERMPDLVKVLSDPTAVISKTAADIIFESEKGPELAYYLAKNTAEARRIAALPERQQIKQLGALEARLSDQVKPRTISNAPKPVTTVASGGGAGPREPASMSVAELQALLYRPK